MKRFRYLFILLLIIKFTSPSNIFGEEQYKLLDYDLWDGEDDQGNKYDVYKPYPIIFVHGFGKGNPDTWKDVIQYSYLKYYFDPYKDYPLSGMCGYLVHNNEKRLPYLELMDMQDKNGSIDTYDNGAYGWADKLAQAIDRVLADSGAEKVILVCHSMGGLAARELVTNANHNYGNYAEKIDRIITIDTPHAGSPLARMASNFGNIYRHGWKFPGIGWVLTILVTPVKAFVEETKDIDLNGEAVRDMDPTELEGASDNPGSHFLLNLGKERGMPNPPVYTISGVCSSSFATLLAGGRYFQNEPSDGVVPLQSQRGYPFVRDYDDGNYIMENGRIKIQERMFPNPEKIERSNFCMPESWWPWYSYIDIESEISASHGGSEGAPFVATGLKRADGIIQPLGKNYILNYLDYRRPEIFIIDSGWKKGLSYYGATSIAYETLFGVKNLFFPANNDLYSYFEQRKQWFMDGRSYGGIRIIRPFENQDPAPAGFIVSTKTMDNIYSPNFPLVGGINNVVVVNQAGIRSNAFEYAAIRVPVQRAWREWKDYRYNTSGSEELYGYASGGKVDKYICDENGNCKDGSDGILEAESKGYMICTIPQEYIGWPIRSAIIGFEGQLPIISIYGYSQSTIISENGFQYMDVTELVKGARTFTVTIEGQSILPGVENTGGFIYGVFIAFEPRDFNPEEQK